ncbi:Guanylyl cyclase [Polychytrium aggregatum]|uniref:Guanylyl cyclase n=1 Tax=Polychytrium aggregatum TaxID=110093 RepID=UPI0022FE12E3|nr:Guanylyl cyclase [Polychytrium aggregatum]KAI9206691.1 Guanylyl cyclase [Polychytrium aggregatum]
MAAFSPRFTILLPTPSPSPSSPLSASATLQQLADWDCGLACVSMVLTALNIPRSSPAELHGICPLQNIWTVDLAYILRRFGVEDFTYYTSYIGVNWQYLSKSFYRDSITEDQSRVHALFAGAADRNVRIVPMILDMNDIRRFLISGKYAVIILVNLSVLNCGTCTKKGYEKISGDDFVGHYILLAGYEPDSDTILYRDPGTNEVLCAVDADDLDVARSSLGTDHDAIVVRVA